MESKTNCSKVKVVVRVRPMLNCNDKPWVTVIDEKTLQTTNHRNMAEALQYEFAAVFDDKCNQKFVYDESVKPVLTQVIQGKNASVFAYGPTGAGKTHTILGTAEEPGVIPRCVKDIFTAIHTEQAAEGGDQWIFKVSFSFLEIYNEKVYDLIKQKEKDLVIREDGHKHIFVVGLDEIPINNIDEFNLSFGPGSKNRTVACTKLNERSSRSHSVLMLKVQRFQKVAPFARRTGKMYIIDLAGSEDNRRSGNEGIRLKESSAINSSLLALGQVVDALNKGQSCVPYRSSKLTRLLQDSLGGNAVTCMIVNLAPEEQNYFNTYQTLHFARKAKKIVNNVKVNEYFDKPVVKVSPFERGKKRIRQRDSKDQTSPPKKHKATTGRSVSPLMHNQESFQNNLRDEMFERIEKLEQQIKHMAEPQPIALKPKKSDGQKSAKENRSPLNDITQFQDQLKQIKKGFNKVTCRNVEVYSDGSSKDDLKQNTNITCSPLFRNIAGISRKMGFKSTGARTILDDVFNSEGTSSEPSTNPSELQNDRNCNILGIINGGSVKDIQGLQTLGPKRAQLIHDWRNLHGLFTNFDDLVNVEGLNKRFVSTFLKRNLIQL